MQQEIKHIFLSSGAARVYTSIYGEKAQGIDDFIKELSNSLMIKILSNDERIISLIQAGSPVEEVDTITRIVRFLTLTGKTSFLHRVVASDTSEKIVERYSEVIVKYYKIISEIGKSQVEDFSEFIDLFPIKEEKLKGCVSHIPEIFTPFVKLFPEKYQWKVKTEKLRKLRFPDYFSEIRWVVRDSIVRSGSTCIVVPDDFFLGSILKEMELYGVKPLVASNISYTVLNDSPFFFLINCLRCVDTDFSYDFVIPTIENQYSMVDQAKIFVIRKLAYENNVIRGLDDWITLFQEAGVSPEILLDLRDLSNYIKQGKGLEGLKKFSEKYIGNTPVLKIVNVLAASFGGVSSDIQEMINYLQALRFFPKVSVPGDGSIVIGKPEDIIGIPFDNIYITGLDSGSSLRSFSDVARSLLDKIGLQGEYDSFIGMTLKKIVESGINVTLTRSELDEKLTFTEGTPFYDSIEAEESIVPRDDIFVPVAPICQWETASPQQEKQKYSLDTQIVKARLEKPIYPTFLENYIGCHFKGFVNGILGVDELDEPVEFLDPRNTGSLTHKILEKFYSTEISPEDFTKLSDSFVRNEISRVRYNSKKMALKFYREKYIQSGRLTRFFMLDVRRSLELGRRIIHREFHFPSNDHSVIYEFNGNKISIGGFVDRVDEQEDGLCIIDYKTSLNGYPKNDLCDEEHGKIQLYFYKLGVESILGKKVRAAAYVSFKDVNEGLSTAGFYQDIPNEEAQIEKCNRIVSSAFQALLEGDCDPVVKEGGSLWKCENQLFCPLLSVCRVQSRRW
ncbi:MAG: PD-(D/E)XK nuclease family protein [Thermoplasmatales archaeon]